jgi:hypothetical protein
VSLLSEFVYMPWVILDHLKFEPLGSRITCRS